jgi:transmembrane sensor
MSFPRPDDTASVQEHAAYWMVEVHDLPRTRAAFADWLKASPRHVEEFLFQQALWNGLDQLVHRDQEEIDRLISEALQSHAEPNVVAIDSPGRGFRRPAEVSAPRTRIGIWLTAAAAMLFFAVTSPYLFKYTHMAPSSEVYVTQVGEQRTVKLEDGSIVYMNTASRIEAHFTRSARQLRLVRGEALFDVAHDSARPFLVAVDNNLIRAIGTQFNVYRRADLTTVAVLEGVVGLSVVDSPDDKTTKGGDVESNSKGRTDVAPPTRLRVGQEAQLSARGDVLSLVHTGVTQAVAWRSRRLVFQSDKLGDIADEFNRYNTVQIRVEGDALRNKRLTGTFNADDPQSLIRFLVMADDVQIDTSEKRVLIRSRR